MNSKFFIIILISLFSVIFFVITYRTYIDSLTLSFYADDWAVIWGVKQQGTIFFNPVNVQWFYHQHEFTSRIGNLQIWMTGIIYQLFQLDAYYYHLSTLILKSLSAISLTIVIYLLSKRVWLGILSGLIFTVTYVGSESIWWYNVSSVYLFIPLVLICFYTFVRSISENNLKLFIISQILIAASIYLYAPRSHIFLGFPLVGLIFSQKLLNKKTWIKVISNGLVIILAFTVLVGNQGTSIASSHLARGWGGIRDGYKVERTLLTYPIDIIAISTFSQSILTKSAIFPPQLKTDEGKFYLWTLVLFPLTWIGFCLLITESTQRNRKTLIIHLSIGLVWLGINFLLKEMFFLKKWEWPLHFSFITSGLMTLLAISCYISVKNKPILGTLSKLLLSSIILTFFGYLVNWFSDPLQFPNYYDSSRYFTVSTVFASVTLASLIYLIGLLVQTKFNGTFYYKFLSNTVLVYILIIFLRWFSMTNLEYATQYSVGGIIDARSGIMTTTLLDAIAKRAKLDAPYPPPLLMFHFFDSIEGNIYIPHASALWQNLNDPKFFPFPYANPDTLSKAYQDYCRQFTTPPPLYTFKVYNLKTVDVTEESPKIICEGLQKQIN